MEAGVKMPLELRRRALETRLAELGVRLDAIEIELDSLHNQDWEDLAIEREGDEVLEATGVAGQHEIRKIRAALHRMDGGTYGICARCGSDIAQERLNTLPYTPFCRSCAT
jgi:RNA polymerase-binding transcription factor DksA